jgi:hypothetical protein
MKKILIIVFTMLSITAFAENKSVSTANEVKTEKAANKAEAKKLVSRLYEIRDYAKSHELNAGEKKQLRDEVKNIKDRLEKMSGVYLYLSITTIIIILLLIILL